MAKVDRSMPGKKSKDGMDPNDRFSHVEQIPQAKKELARQLKSLETVSKYPRRRDVFPHLSDSDSVREPGCAAERQLQRKKGARLQGKPARRVG